jgi:hypothetical protein
MALFVVIFGPALVLLEQIAAHEPGFAPARAWLHRGLATARNNWCQATQLCGDFRELPRPSAPQTPR